MTPLLEMPGVGDILTVLSIATGEKKVTPQKLRAQSAQKVAKKKPKKEAVKEVVEETKCPPVAHQEEIEFDARSEAQPEVPKAKPSTSYEMGEEYLWQIYFDRTLGKYFGSVLEFPEVRAEGATRDGVMTEVSHQVQQKLVSLKMAGERAPEPILQRTYPDKLEVPVSQTLFRKLDIHSRQERVGFEQMIGEALTALVERRGENRSQRPQQSQPSGNHDRGQQRYQQHRDHRDNRNHQQHNSQRNRNNYNQGMDSGGDNFLEYVRNLEKRGGAAGKYRREEFS